MDQNDVKNDWNVKAKRQETKLKGRLSHFETGLCGEVMYLLHVTTHVPKSKFKLYNLQIS